MIVLGIDPGLARTGYAIVEDRPLRPQAVAYGVIRTNPAEPIAARLSELYADLVALIGEYGPREAAIEEVFVNKNLQTASSVGRASGVAILAAARSGCAVHEYTPTAVKSAVTGHGGAPKEQLGKVVARRLGLREISGPADAADALAVAICHLQARPLAGAIEAAR